MAQTDLSRLIAEFSSRIVSMVEEATSTRIQAALAGAFGPQKRGPGRPPKAALLGIVGGPLQRRKAPKQLCPVPGCKNAAAPVFGMVCSKHKDLPKAKIKKYREARRAAKAKGK